VQLHHFGLPTSSCVHALCILRLTAPRSRAERDAIVERLCSKKVFEAARVEDSEEEQSGRDVPSQFVLGAWRPRTAEQHAAALEVVRTVDAFAGWLFALSTTIDAVTAESTDQGDVDDDDDFDDDDLDDDDDDDDDLESGAREAETSVWRFGPPPLVTSVTFPVDRYPSILDDFDGEDFGLAVKLAEPTVPGEDEVLVAFHQLWISAYVDPRVEHVPFRSTAITYDATHRAGLLWIDRFNPPVTRAEVVHHLLGIADAIHSVLPIVHARFAGATMEQKYNELQGEPVPLVLAGNPLVHAFQDDGEAAALAWTKRQTTWSDREVAAMFVEIGVTFDPDEPEPSAMATKMFDRALALDPEDDDAISYALQALIRSGRVDEGLARVRTRTEPGLRGLVFELVADHAPARLRDALAVLDTETFVDLGEEKVGEFLATLASSDPEALVDLLPRLPRISEMVSPIYNASHKCEDRTLAQRLLEFAMDMPEPAAGEDRSSFLFAFNNACVNAFELKDFPRARAIADRAQKYAEENPYIFHGAACAYVAVGELDKAMYQVERAIARDYEQLDRLEVDHDLGELLTWPQFVALFAARRELISKSEPVMEIDSDVFASEVLGAARPVLVDFSASWCGPCQMQTPILDKLAQTSGGRFRIVKVDIDECNDLAERYDATSVPTLVVFASGEEVVRTAGLTQRAELEALLSQAGVVWDTARR